RTKSTDANLTNAPDGTATHSQFANVPRTGPQSSAPILSSVRIFIAVLLMVLCPQAMPAAAGAQKLPRFAGCKSFFARSAHGTVRPRSIVLACGDGNFYVTRIAWSRWMMRE